MKSNRECKMNNENKLPLRADKTLVWLEESRDKWKEKCKETKLRLKRQTFAVKRLKNNRDDWKLTSIRLKQELSENKEKIASLQFLSDELNSQLQAQQNEIHVLKKKR